MKTLRFKFISSQDIARIIRVAESADISCSPPEAYLLWRCHSDSWCAGWLGLPESDSELLEIIESKLIDKEIEL